MRPDRKDTRAPFRSSLPKVCGSTRSRDPLTLVIALDEALLEHLLKDPLGHAARLWLGLQPGVLLQDPIDGGQLLLDSLCFDIGRHSLVLDRLLSTSALTPDLHEMPARALALYSQKCK